jgi:L-aspartate oxidase
MITRTCDFLVIGSGLAGLTAALRLSRIGHVIVATKKVPELSNSDWAQGGIAAVVAPMDSIDGHVADTLTAGAGLCNETVVRRIVEAGPDRVRGLEAYGVRFERGPDGYDLGTEGGHSHRRVLHAGDITGHEVMKVLLERAREQPTLEILPQSPAIDLVTTGWLGHGGPSRCVGAYFLDTGRDEVFAICAQATLLATGGAGKVYLYTTNPDVAVGDGIAMAWRAGLPIKNMECVQFHPTCLYHPQAKSFLISEAVRGEGARLLNGDGESFTERYDPRAALAPRDIVARAIDHEMKQRGDTCVYLDISHKPRAFLQRRFPTIYAEVLRFGFDMAEEPIPVVPAAHYFCGGVEAGVDGSTALQSLYACGEVACTGLHGANRLASNSLLEAMVCAHNAAERIASEYSPSRIPPIHIPDWQPGDAVPSDEAVVVEHNWNEVRTSMWDYVGIVRTNRRLERALRRIRNLRREIRQYYLEYLVTADVLELRNLASVAELVVRSAFIRKESRGLHFTLDYPTVDSSQPPRDTRIVDPPGEALLAGGDESAG